MPIPLGAWAPDMPPYTPGVLVEATNVLPVPAGYGPARGLTEVGDALAARCQGVFGFIAEDGIAQVYAGTEEGLYRATALSAGDYTYLATEGGTLLVDDQGQFFITADASDSMWEDVSKSTYTTPESGGWRFVRFGDLVIATNFTDPIQSYDITGGTGTDFEDLDSSAPKARHMAVVRGFVMVGYCQVSSTVHPQRVWWSAIEDATTWPTPGTDAAIQVQSDYQDLLDGDGVVMGIASGLGSADAIIFMERAVYRVTYLGGALVFSFDKIEGARGLAASNAFVVVGGLCYYLGEDGFYATDGIRSQHIGASNDADLSFVDRFFAEDFQGEYGDRIYASADPSRKLIYWTYPSVSAVAGAPNRTLVYGWQTRRWTVIHGQGARMFFNLWSFGYTLDTLDQILPRGIDDDSIPVDSGLYSGGRQIFAAMSSDNYIAFETGDQLEARLTTADAQIVPGRGALVTEVWPYGDPADVYATVGTRERLSDTPRLSAEGGMNEWGLCPVEARGRWHRLTLRVPQGTNWTNLAAYDVTARATGARV